MDKKAKELNFSEQPVLAPGALEKFKAYHWPGNARELENLVERTIIRSLTMSPGKLLEFETLTPVNDPKESAHGPEIDNDFILLDDVTRQHIKKVLKMAKGKVQGENGAAERYCG